MIDDEEIIAGQLTTPDGTVIECFNLCNKYEMLANGLTVVATKTHRDENGNEYWMSSNSKREHSNYGDEVVKYYRTSTPFSELRKVCTITVGGEQVTLSEASEEVLRNYCNLPDYYGLAEKELEERWLYRSGMMTVAAEQGYNV